MPLDQPNDKIYYSTPPQQKFVVKRNDFCPLCLNVGLYILLSNLTPPRQ